MFIIFVILNIGLLTAASEKESANFNGRVSNRNQRGVSNTQESYKNGLMLNTTYIDKSDNLLRVPNKYYEEQITKKKIKKVPKRTVQKIIKKNKLKTRKLYLFPATVVPTASNPVKVESETKNVVSTTEGSYKKKQRKYTRYVRYPMPFQKLKKDAHSRYKREDGNVFILKDLDEIQFLSEEKDHDKFVAHVQNYW